MTDSIDLTIETTNVRAACEAVLRAHELYKDMSKEEQIRFKKLLDILFPN